MDNKDTRSWFMAYRHYGLVVAFAIVAGAGMWLLASYLAQESAIVEQQETVWKEQGIVIDGPVLEKSSPMRLRIPSVGIDTGFEGALGLNDDQTIEVPDSFEEVGWYQYGPTPGELGPAVVLGHVDSYEGPAVFFSLGRVQEGDVIEIDRRDGSTARFEVTHLERHPQSGFPTEAVYSDIDHAGLRLITCTGVYDRGKQVYTHNLIVFARLIE